MLGSGCLVIGWVTLTKHWVKPIWHEAIKLWFRCCWVHWAGTREYQPSGEGIFWFTSSNNAHWVRDAPQIRAQHSSPSACWRPELVFLMITAVEEWWFPHICRKTCATLLMGMYGFSIRNGH